MKEKERDRKGKRQIGIEGERERERGVERNRIRGIESERKGEREKGNAMCAERVGDRGSSVHTFLSV